MTGETLKDCFQDSFLRAGKKTAVTFLRKGRTETEISYLGLDQDAGRLAKAFLEMGVRKGDRVVFFFDKSLFFVVAHLGVQKLGAVSVPFNPGVKKSEMAYLLGDVKARLVLCGPDQERMIEEIDPELTRPDFFPNIHAVIGRLPARQSKGALSLQRCNRSDNTARHVRRQLRNLGLLS